MLRVTQPRQEARIGGYDPHISGPRFDDHGREPAEEALEEPCHCLQIIERVAQMDELLAEFEAETFSYF